MPRLSVLSLSVPLDQWNNVQEQGVKPILAAISPMHQKQEESGGNLDHQSAF